MSDEIKKLTEQEESYIKAEKITITGDDGTIIEMVKEPILKAREGNLYWAQVHGINLIAKELVIPPDQIAQTPLLIERFKKNAALMSNIDDPRIAGKVFGLIESDGKYYLLLYPYFKEDKKISEFNALTLQNLFSQIDFKLSKSEKFDIVSQLSRIVLDLHKRGIYHMDLKPGNIIYYDDFLKLIDFGMLMDRRKNIDTIKKVPDLQFMAGTPEYSSPERILLVMNPDETEYLNTDEKLYASEIFSFAAVAFKIVTGKSLFKGIKASDSANLVLNMQLGNPDNNVAESFNFKIDGLEGFTPTQKDKLKEAFKLLFVEEPEIRLKNFPEIFLKTLSEAFDDSTNLENEAA